MTIKFYSNAWRKGGWGKLFRSAEAYKHCLNIINAFLEKWRLFYNGKKRLSCQRVVSGNKANVA